MLNVNPASRTWTNLSRVDCTTGGPQKKPAAKSDRGPASGLGASTSAAAAKAAAPKIAQTRPREDVAYEADPIPKGSLR
jgi:hypothetical protein